MKFPKISNVCGLVTAASVGWLASEWKNSKYIDTRHDIPIYDTVSAAVTQDQMIPYNDASQLQPAPNASRISQILQFGFPSLSNIRSMHDYVISYDTRNRIPNWVFEHLNADSLVKHDGVTRERAHFHEDDTFHPYFRGQNRDYKSSGYDRGHMAAAGNHKQNQQNCNETFILSNMAPQVGKGFNRDKWNDLESYVRSLVKSFPNVYVCTGPLYLPRKEADGKNYVKYEVIGPNHVSVPTHFYKVILCEANDGKFELEVYLLPNEAIDDSVPLTVFKVPLETVERASGLLFLNKLDVNRISKTNGLLRLPKKSSWF